MIQTSDITRVLQDALDPSYLVVEDESAAHAGHYQSNGGVTHITVHIQSPHLVGSRVAQTRSVMRVLQPFLSQGLHAVSLVLLPSEPEAHPPCQSN